MKVSDTPERWVIIKILLNNNTYYKVFGAYSGTYLTGERWQINSGIRKATQDDEYIYYKSGCWFTQDGYQIPDSYWLNAQKQGWDDTWSVVS